MKKFERIGFDLGTAGDFLHKFIHSDSLPASQFLISVGNNRRTHYEDFCSRTHSRLLYTRPLFTGVKRVLSIIAASDIAVIELPKGFKAEAVLELSQWGTIHLIWLRNPTRIEFIIESLRDNSSSENIYTVLEGINTEYLLLELNSEDDKNISIDGLSSGVDFPEVANA